MRIRNNWRIRITKLLANKSTVIASHLLWQAMEIYFLTCYVRNVVIATHGIPVRCDFKVCIMYICTHDSGSKFTEMPLWITVWKDSWIMWLVFSILLMATSHICLSGSDYFSLAMWPFHGFSLLSWSQVQCKLICKVVARQKLHDSNCIEYSAANYDRSHPGFGQGLLRQTYSRESHNSNLGRHFSSSFDILKMPS